MSAPGWPAGAAPRGKVGTEGRGGESTSPEGFRTCFAVPEPSVRAATLSTCLALLVQCSPADPTTQACREPTTLRFNIAGKIARSALGFTQGLEFRDGKLYESTGRIGGTTQFNVISLTGEVTTKPLHFDPPTQRKRVGSRPVMAPAWRSR